MLVLPKFLRCSQAHKANFLFLLVLTEKKSQCSTCSRMLAKTIRHPLSIRENLVMMSPYVHRSVQTLRVELSRKEFLSPLDSLVYYCFNRLEKSESIYCANVWWILTADNLTFEEAMISEKSILETDFEV